MIHLRWTVRDKIEERKFPNHVLIGRRSHPDHAGVDLDLAVRSVSRRHARIWLDDQGCWIEHLSQRATPGTYLNGENLHGKGPQRLEPGAHIRIDTIELKLLAVRKESFAPRLRVEVRHEGFFNCARQSSGIPCIHSITLFNDGVMTVKGAALEIALGNLCRFGPVPLPEVPAGGSITVPSDPRGIILLNPSDPFLQLVDRTVAPLTIEVNGERLPVEDRQIEIHPPQAWYESEDEAQTLAAFVLPSSRAVEEIVDRAREELERLVDKSGIEDVTYESVRSTLRWPQVVDVTVEAIYSCLQKHYQIDYDREQYRRTEGLWQVVLLPSQVVGQRKGTCIDLAVLLAACLESLFLDPLIIVICTGADNGVTVWHALVGCWRTRDRMQGSVERNGQRVLDWVESNDLLLLDAVGFARGPAGQQCFSDSRKRAGALLEKACRSRLPDCGFVFAVDIKQAAKNVLPLPLGDAENFDLRAALARQRARQRAETLGHSQVSTRHLFLALLDLKGGVMTQVLERVLDEHDQGRLASVIEKMKAATAASLPRSNAKAQVEASLPAPKPTTNYKGVLDSAKKPAANDLIREIDLVRAILDVPNTVHRILEEFDVTPEACRKAVDALQQSGFVESVFLSLRRRGSRDA